MSETLRWGILGTGMIAGKFAADLKATTQGELAATGSRNQSSADGFAAEHGGKASQGMTHWLTTRKSMPFTILCPTGFMRNGPSKPWRRENMSSAKNRWRETLPRSRRCFACLSKTGQILVEAFMYRSHPAIQKLIDTVRGGALGQVKLIRSNFSFTREVMESDARYQVEHAGGGLMDVGCYCVNLARAVMGSEPTETACFAHIHEKGVDDYAAGLLRFGEKTLMTFTCGMTVHNDWTTYISGDDGEIEIQAPWFCDGTFKVTREGKTELIEAKTDKPMYALEAEAFAVAVAGETPWITKEDTLGNMKVLDQLRSISSVPVPAR